MVDLRRPHAVVLHAPAQFHLEGCPTTTVPSDEDVLTKAIAMVTRLPYSRSVPCMIVVIPPSEIPAFICSYPRYMELLLSMVLHVDTSLPMPSMDPAVWFSPANVIPPHVAARHRRPMPTLAPPRVPNPVADTLILGHDAYAALDSALGLISWFMMVIPALGFVRLGLQDLLRTALWTLASIQSFDVLLALLPFLTSWLRPARPQGVGVSISVDAGRGWGAVLRSGATVIRVADSLPSWVLPYSSTAREAAGCLAALMVVFSLGVPCDHAVFGIDCNSFVEGATAGSSRSPAVLASAGPLAAIDAQGFSSYFAWRRRTEEDHPFVDALSPAVATRVWALRPAVLSYMWDQLGGWDLDIAASQSSSTTDSYATGDMPDTDRTDILSVASSSSATQGWIGQTSSVALAVGEVAFAHPPWSTLPLLAHRIGHTQGTMFIVAPRDGAGQWWSTALLAIQRASVHTLPLGPSATTPLVDLRSPGAPDPRPLAVYVVGPRTPRVRPRPRWWCPWMLCADGDIHPRPGPRKEFSMADLFGSPPSRQTQTETVPPTATDSPPACPAKHSRRPFDLQSLFATTPTRTHSGSQAIIQMSAALPAPPSAALRILLSTQTLGQWLMAVIDFHRGAGGRIIDASIPDSLHAEMAHVSSVVRMKAVMGSSRVLRAPRRLLQLSRVKAIEHHPFSLPLLDALAQTYAVNRLRKPPPFGWEAANAATTASDLSAVAASSRRTGAPVPEYCGPGAGVECPLNNTLCLY
jgi:hypothetical protein